MRGTERIEKEREREKERDLNFYKDQHNSLIKDER